MNANNQIRTDDELKRSAGEILNGVKRTVEVQVVNPNTFNFQDQTILGRVFLLILSASTSTWAFYLMTNFQHIFVHVFSQISQII